MTDVEELLPPFFFVCIVAADDPPPTTELVAPKQAAKYTPSLENVQCHAGPLSTYEREDDDSPVEDERVLMGGDKTC